MRGIRRGEGAVAALAPQARAWLSGAMRRFLALVLSLCAGPVLACDPPPDPAERFVLHVGVGAVATQIDHGAGTLRHVLSLTGGEVLVIDHGGCPARLAVSLLSRLPVVGPERLDWLAGVLAETAVAEALPGGPPDGAHLAAAFATPEALELTGSRKAGAWDASQAVLPAGGSARASYAPLAFPWGVMLGLELSGG